MERTRLATLVVVDEHGTVAGTTEARPVALPWWQETVVLAEAFPELLGRATGGDEVGWAGRHAVLRLLRGEPDETTGHMGGRTTHLVQAERATIDGAATAVGLRPWTGPADVATAAEPLRLPWARPGGPLADLRWVAAQVDITGRPVQRRTWNLSALWSIPTGEGTVWLKCLPPFFRHEPAVLQIMGDGPVPRRLAADGHRVLMAELPGEDGFDADEATQVRMVDTLVDLQQASAGRVDRLLAAGVPDHRTSRLVDDLRAFVERVAPDSGPLRALADELADRMAVVDRVGLPDVLVHGDPHSGNCRMGVEPPVWFDWGDSFIGNPLLDLGAVHRMPPTAVERWLGRWSTAVGGLDLGRIWVDLQPVAQLRTAWVFQQFLDQIEAAEQVYHHNDVPETLGRVEALLRP